MKQQDKLGDAVISEGLTNYFLVKNSTAENKELKKYDKRLKVNEFSYLGEAFRNISNMPSRT